MAGLSIFPALLLVVPLLTACSPAQETENMGSSETDVPELYAPNSADGRFFNPWQPFRKGALDLIRFLLGPNPYDKKRDVQIPRVENDGSTLAGTETSASITWAGHATAIIHDGPDVVLTDPHLGERALLVPRKSPPGVPVKAIPEHAIAVISHNHYDHLDEETVLALPGSTRWFVPTGLGQWFRERGRGNVTELGWWQSTQVENWTISCVPAQHWSRRIGQSTNTTLWCGWILQSPSATYFYSGDTGYFGGFREIGRRFGPIDVALLPIGAYEPRWFMAYQHMNPAEAYQAFLDLGSRFMIPIHWGTFDLSYEPLDQPVLDLADAIERAGGDPSAVRILAIGENWRVPEPANREHERPGARGGRSRRPESGG